jgi:hypothetical protein
VQARIPTIAGRGPSPKLVSIAADALTGVEPVVVVNRRVDTALTQLSAPPDTPFATLHDDARSDPKTRFRKVVRGVNERVRGTYGEGAAAGHTTYGSVRFVPTSDAARGAEAVVAALRDQGDVGVRAFGPVSFIADPDSIAGRTTFAADDTGATLAPVRGADELATVVAERIVRSAGRDGPDPAYLESLAPQAARDAVRGWLLSSELARSDNYIEAQVRRLTTADLLAGVVDLRGDAGVQLRKMIEPGPVPDAADSDAIARGLDAAKVGAWLVDADAIRPTHSAAAASSVSA